MVKAEKARRSIVGTWARVLTGEAVLEEAAIVVCKAGSMFLAQSSGCSHLFCAPPHAVLPDGCPFSSAEAMSAMSGDKC